MRLSHLFAFLVACLVFVSALCLIYQDATHAMQFSGWALISYLCYLIALTGENGDHA
jgi:threonine/homoserine/homoserine lactone efflux protein